MSCKHLKYWEESSTEYDEVFCGQCGTHRKAVDVINELLETHDLTQAVVEAGKAILDPGKSLQGSIDALDEALTALEGE